MDKLSGDDTQTLAKKLTSTLSFEDLEFFVEASTGDKLYDFFIAPAQAKFPAIVRLLDALELLGKTRTFLAYVYDKRPGRPDVRELIVDYFPEAVTVPHQKKIELSVQKKGAPQDGESTNALTPGLQRNVKPYISTPDIHVWSDRLIKVERRVCRVELEGAALGTGFLVGPDTVLTNWHVFEAAKSASKVDKLGCRFDYEVLSDGTIQPGQLVMLAGADALDISPYSPGEKAGKPDDPLPTAEQLDYALLRLAMRLGDQQVDGVTRGWIALPKTVLPLAADAPILIVQHPEGSPMKLAMDTEAVVGLNGNGTRLRYRTNTDRGSSGSPVFSMDWSLVALHHYGDPKYLAPLYNQGVPIELIRQRIEKDGQGGALGA
jgi:V8-like Glu-specific endopeptidase